MSDDLCMAISGEDRCVLEAGHAGPHVSKLCRWRNIEHETWLAEQSNNCAAMEAKILTAFRQWEGLVSGDHDHLENCYDTHVFQITNPFRGRPLFWIRCEHAYAAEFQPTETIRP